MGKVLSSRRATALVCFVILLTLVISFRIWNSKPTLLAEWTSYPITTVNDRLKTFQDPSCLSQLDWLKDVDIDYPINYAYRDILVNPVPSIKRASLTKVEEELFPQNRKIDWLPGRENQALHCKDPLVLDVPVFPYTPVDASHIVFGMSTTLERLNESTVQIVRWLAHTRARLFVVIRKPDDKPTPKSAAVIEVQSQMRRLGMNVTLVSPLKKSDSYPECVFSLVKIMYHNRDFNTKWITLIDDDTFFPSIPSLLSMLAKYNHTELYYIGAVSEDWWSVTRYGLMAFGGAGIFLSIAMAEVLDDKYQACREDIHPAAGGDERVMRCVYTHTTTKLTNVPELHQIDVWGDLSGMYESGRLPLSLHHWKGSEYPVWMMNMVTDICGDCFLQRWQFGSKTVLSNGFSIAQYPLGRQVDDLDMNKAEQTWEARTAKDSVNPGTAHSLSPARRKLRLDEEKLQYRLIHSDIIDGGVKQAYLRRGKYGDVDTLLVLFWKRMSRSNL